MGSRSDGQGWDMQVPAAAAYMQPTHSHWRSPRQHLLVWACHSRRGRGHPPPRGCAGTPAAAPATAWKLPGPAGPPAAHHWPGRPPAPRWPPAALLWPRPALPGPCTVGSSGCRIEQLQDSRASGCTAVGAAAAAGRCPGPGRLPAPRWPPAALLRPWSWSAAWALQGALCVGVSGCQEMREHTRSSACGCLAECRARASPPTLPGRCRRARCRPSLAWLNPQS